MSDLPKVVSLHGGPVAVPSGEPHPDIIEKIESVLEAARRGDVLGVMISTVVRVEGGQNGSQHGLGGCFSVSLDAQWAMIASMRRNMRGFEDWLYGDDPLK